MECHVCRKPFEPYPGHDKWCRDCRDEIEDQQERMRARGDFANDRIDLDPWRAYLGAFDRFLGGDPKGRLAMVRELGAVYQRKGIEPPAHRHDLKPSGTSGTLPADDPDDPRSPLVRSTARLLGGARTRGRDRHRPERVVR